VLCGALLGRDGGILGGVAVETVAERARVGAYLSGGKLARVGKRNPTPSFSHPRSITRIVCEGSTVSLRFVQSKATLSSGRTGGWTLHVGHAAGARNADLSRVSSL
jgi:hypothetical protein